MEIVTEPDLESPAEAKMFIQKLRQILRYLSVSDANMEKGHLRCDANIDVKKIQNSKLKSQKSGNPILNNSKIHNLKPITYSMSPIVEIKNLNSFKFIEKALLYEEQRLTDDFENWPEKPIKLTRGFDSKSGQTYQQRTKEEASDYRYFPEPDLPPFKFSASQIGKIRETLPELPDQRVARYLHDYKINQHDAENLASDVRLAEYFEEVVAEKVSAQKAANWILTELLGKINKSGEDFTENKIKPADFAQLINKIETGEISGKMAKEILEIMFKSGKSAEKVICELNLKVISKDEELEEIAGDVIKNNPKVAEDFKSGKTQALQFLVGQIMRQTQGRANPTKIAEILTKKLK